MDLTGKVASPGPTPMPMPMPKNPNGKPIPRQALRHRNPYRGVHDKRHRVDQRSHQARGERPRSLPTEQAALKCVYLAIMSLDPTGTGQKRWSNRWKAALNAFEVTFDGRLAAGRR